LLSEPTVKDFTFAKASSAFTIIIDSAMEQQDASYSPYTLMTTSRDAPNPLRPYYIPPSIGLPPETPVNATPAGGRAPAPPPSSSKTSFGSSARDILSDLEYGDYLTDSPSAAAMAKKLANQAMWNYTSVFLAQPFEVAKTVLQCHLAAGPGPVHYKEDTRRQRDGYREAQYQDVRAGR